MCTAALAILDRLDVVDVDTLAWWLAERQLPNGGLNGRPEKLEDVRNAFVVSSIHLRPDIVPPACHFFLSNRQVVLPVSMFFDSVR